MSAVAKLGATVVTYPLLVIKVGASLPPPFGTVPLSVSMGIPGVESLVQNMVHPLDTHVFRELEG